MYFSVGYPLGYFRTSNAPEYRNKIEFNGKFAMLDVFLTAAWSVLDASISEDLAFHGIEELISKLSYIPNNYPAHKVLEKLKEKGVVIQANSNEELFIKIKDFKVIRNGFPQYDVETMEKSKELKHVILNGGDPIPISDLQIEIWRKADGTKTLEQIYNEYFFDINIFNFIKNIFFLKDEILIFII